MFSRKLPHPATEHSGSRWDVASVRVTGAKAERSDVLTLREGHLVLELVCNCLEARGCRAAGAHSESVPGTADLLPHKSDSERPQINTGTVILGY